MNDNNTFQHDQDEHERRRNIFFYGKDPITVHPPEPTVYLMEKHGRLVEVTEAEYREVYP
jgi:hypothetical protein